MTGITIGRTKQSADS